MVPWPSRCSSIDAYNGTTGAFVRTFASGGGLIGPTGLVFGPNGNLFVASESTFSVLEYNGTTGAFVRTFTSGGGPVFPFGLAFGPSGDLFVSSVANNLVLEYNGTTGAFVRTIPSRGGLDLPTGLAFGPKYGGPVPEPSGVVLLATGLAWLSLGYVRRRRTRPRPAQAD
jgi:hypothetical protein